MTKNHRLFQVDTYKCANGDFKEILEAKFNEIATHPEWWTTKTQEWEGHYNDYGPPVHTWVVSDRTKDEILAIARTVCPYAEIAGASDPIRSESDLNGMLGACRPKRYDKIKLTEEELQRRLDIEDWSFYLSYGLKGWHTWWMERIRAMEKGRKWKPKFPTEIQFSKEKLLRLYQESEKLQNIWEMELDVPNHTNLLAMIGMSELIQIAKHECEMEDIPEGVDGETLLDMILWEFKDIHWKTSEGHNRPQVTISFQDPGMFNKSLELGNIRRLKENLDAHGESYANAIVTWRNEQFLFWREVGSRDWHGTVRL